MATFEARSPLTGEVIKVFEEAGEADVRRAMDRARRAFASWKDRSVEERVSFVRGLKRAVLGDMDGIVRKIVEATGKVELEAQSSDVWAALEVIQYCEDHAAEVLATEKRPASLIFMGASCFVEYRPMGVVAVFSPWNYPFQLAMVPLVSALVAGNAVILKPSEITPTVGEIIASLCLKAELPRDVVQVVQGGRDAGQRLIRAMPDKIFFTGSLAAGRSIMEAASRGPIPVDLELSGKDPMIVFDDANLERAANAAVFGAFANAGQACVAIERCYVQGGIYETFVEAVVTKTKRLRVGRGPDADIGAIISPRQIEIIDDHVHDAVARGARVLAGGVLRESFYRPVVLADVTHEMKVMREETFGPVLPILRFSTEDEAVALANDSEFGLNAAVFSGDLRRARRVAARLAVGSCAVNDVSLNIANAHAPFGGVKHSGFGKSHGPEGLRAFCHQVSVLVSPGRLKRQPYYFPYSRRTVTLTRKLMHVLYGDRKILKPVKPLLDLLTRLG
jgi:acyl-CoA reductase-like NAD-dependent aldehyde dehydrogenase